MAGGVLGLFLALSPRTHIVPHIICYTRAPKMSLGNKIFSPITALGTTIKYTLKSVRMYLADKNVPNRRFYIIPNLSSTLLNFIHPVGLCPCFQMPWSLVGRGSCLPYQIRDVRRGSHLTLQIPHPLKTAPQSESVYLLNFWPQHSLTTSSQWARLRQSFCEGKEIRERQGRVRGAV